MTIGSKNYWKNRMGILGVLWCVIIFFGVGCSNPEEKEAPAISKIWKYTSNQSPDKTDVTMDLRPDGKYYDTLREYISGVLDETEIKAGTYTYTDTKLIIVTDQTYTFTYVMTATDTTWTKYKLILSRAGETKELVEVYDY